MMLYGFDMEKYIESEKAYEHERGREDGLFMMLHNLMETMHISEKEAGKYLKL
jgi:hypothetical protein